MAKAEPLDPILHQPLRLAIISYLVQVRYADFNEIKEKTDSTAGNLSVQLSKLKEAGYITIEKSYKDNYPLTRCSMTKAGTAAWKNYCNQLMNYLKRN
jgi:DNA-binding transcriptional ArsR family regulator